MGANKRHPIWPGLSVAVVVLVAQASLLCCCYGLLTPETVQVTHLNHPRATASHQLLMEVPDSTGSDTVSHAVRSVKVIEIFELHRFSLQVSVGFREHEDFLQERRHYHDPDERTDVIKSVSDECRGGAPSSSSCARETSGGRSKQDHQRMRVELCLEARVWEGMKCGAGFCPELQGTRCVTSAPINLSSTAAGVGGSNDAGLAILTFDFLSWAPGRLRNGAVVAKVVAFVTEEGRHPLQAREAVSSPLVHFRVVAHHFSSPVTPLFRGGKHRETLEPHHTKVFHLTDPSVKKKRKTKRRRDSHPHHNNTDDAVSPIPFGHFVVMTLGCHRGSEQLQLFFFSAMPQDAPSTEDRYLKSLGLVAHSTSDSESVQSHDIPLESYRDELQDVHVGHRPSSSSSPPSTAKTGDGEGGLYMAVFNPNSLSPCKFHVIASGQRGFVGDASDGRGSDKDDGIDWLAILGIIFEVLSAFV